MTNRLTRSRRDRMIAGVCGGIAQYFEVDPVLVRLVFAVLGFSGVGIPLYIVLWIIMPQERASDYVGFGPTSAYTGYQPRPETASTTSPAGSPAGTAGATPPAGAPPTGSAGSAAAGSSPWDTTPPTWASASGSTGGAAPADSGSPWSVPGSAGASFGASDAPEFGPYPWIDADLQAAKDRRRPAILALLLIGAGLLLLLNNLGLMAWIPWRMIWPAALIVVGVALLLGKKGRRRSW